MLDLSAVLHPNGQLELIETIGKGNFGFVYRGRMASNGQIAAIKVVALKAEELREILLEVEILQQCHHANIVGILALFARQPQDLWICMEFCGGGAVDSVYRKLQRPLTEDEIAVILHESVKGLDYLHNNSFIHRDIKGGNILLTHDGHVKLADFGVSAHLVPEKQFRAMSFIGTPYWMAPEVIMMENRNFANRGYDAKADIWSIGITVIELADKNPPLSDIHPMHALHMIPGIDLRLLMVREPKKWSKRLVSFIQHCLVKDPTLRPSATETLAHPFMARVTPWTQSGQANAVIMGMIESLARQNELQKSGQKSDAKQRAKQSRASSDAEEESTRDVVPQQQQQQNNQHAIVVQAPQAESNQAANAITLQIPTKVAPGQLSPVTIEAGRRSRSPSVISSFFNRSINRGIAQEIFAEPDEAWIQMHQRAHNNGPFQVLPLGLTVRQEINCAEILHVPCNDYTRVFLLMGTDDGLYALEVQTDPTAPQQHTWHLILNSRVKQIFMIDELEQCLMLAGQRSEIRAYSLRHLRSVIRTELNLQPPVDETMQREEASLAPPSTNFNFFQFGKRRRDYTTVQDTDGTQLFSVTRTISTIYLGVLFKSSMTVYEWARAPYNRFMKIKSFWLPETPKFFELCHDGSRITEVLVGYKREGNRIDFETSKITDIAVDQRFTYAQPHELYGNRNQMRWRTWTRIPKNEEIDVIAPVMKRKTWTATLQSMKRPERGERPEQRYLATYGCRSWIVNDAGEPTVLNSEYPVCVKNISWIPPESQSQVTAPGRLVLAADTIMAAHEHDIHVVSIQNGDFLQSFHSEHAMRILVPVEGDHFGFKRRGRCYIAVRDEKRSLTRVYWLHEVNFDLGQFEAEQQQQLQEVLDASRNADSEPKRRSVVS